MYPMAAPVFSGLFIDKIVAQFMRNFHVEKFLVTVQRLAKLSKEKGYSN